MIARAVKTFEATVTGGRLEHESLRQLEGARVQVTVECAATESPKADSDADASDEEDAQPPEWLDVETEVYVPMRGKIEVLKGVKIVDEGRARPTIVLPEELPDD